ncbi:glycosyltransferase [Sporolactobacillus sp. STSJ-5]|uniref:glycosyltransferase n=1 Tax=Sporolactobacillus sp. STSJ-5 TaxID=2965076 RepID=UPI0021028225|nr:glycosyltransferase [Sporolactobacillus sp. STSJ-5]MCQ2011624.1 glycosyltransferase [Sporolactobacillus sp. STSJ-5]
MKLFYVLDYVSGYGGVETVISDVIKKLISNGQKVFVLLSYPSENNKWEETLPNVYYYSSKDVCNETYLIDRAIGLAETMSELPSPDVIITTHVPATTLFAKIAIGSRSNIPIISWLHNPFFSDGLRYANFHWCISHEIEHKLSQMRIENLKLKYIGNPISLGVENIMPIIGNQYVYIGRLENKQKRINLLFKTLSMLNFNWKLNIYGDGPDRRWLTNLAKMLKIDKQVIFHGWRRNPWNEIEKISALVLTSDFEGLPMVVLEALARGIPVISTDSGGTSDLIINEKNGYLVEKNNPEKLKEAFEKFNFLNENELIKMSQEAKESTQQFSTDAVVNRMLESISLLTGKQGGK